MKTGNLRKYRWFWLLAALLLVGLACNLLSTPAVTPTSTIPVSTEDAGKLEAQLTQVVGEALKGETIELSFTEAEISSYLTLRLQDLPDVQLSAIQVYLRDGKVQIFASYTKGLLTLPLQVTFLPKLDADGNVTLVLDSMKMGSVPVPDALKSTIQDEANNAFTEMISSSGKNLFIESLTIQDGSFNLRGRLR